MSTGLYGADPEELHHFAQDLDRAHTVLLTITQELNARITSRLRWEGPDAFVFRHAWQSSYAPVIAQTAAMLKATEQQVTTQANEQQEASR
ncbi:hypothetical protein [Arthrobacter sp. E3]|uniref:hypothetical protein n=1 Tax=Arthrobacter sp. E3 TaxID=517402 RepID=UPI001A952B46|nr:hypothetical protein [Arthrobacter sp. E3]